MQTSSTPRPDIVADQPSAADYALIGDGRAAALVSRTGAIDWLCLPHFSAPSIFAALLDQDRGGTCSVRPSEKYQAHRRYLPRTPVLETTFEIGGETRDQTAGGRVRVIDFFPVDQDSDRLMPMREVVRIIEGVAGTVTLDIIVDPQPDYARRRVEPRDRGKFGFAYTWSRNLFLVRSDMTLSVTGTALKASVNVGAGQRLMLSLVFVENDIGVIPVLGLEMDQRLAATIAWWQ